MPLYARMARYFLFAVLAYLAAWSGWRFLLDRDNALMLVSGIWLCATIVGLYRRVAWGRFYVSCISVLAVFIAALLMIPFDPSELGTYILHDIIVFSPLLAWLIVVAVSVAMLMPAFLIGIRKDWFRSAWW
jgi:hypothetical protein